MIPLAPSWWCLILHGLSVFHKMDIILIIKIKIHFFKYLGFILTHQLTPVWLVDPIKTCTYFITLKGLKPSRELFYYFRVNVRLISSRKRKVSKHFTNLFPTVTIGNKGPLSQTITWVGVNTISNFMLRSLQPQQFNTNLWKGRYNYVDFAHQNSPDDSFFSTSTVLRSCEGGASGKVVPGLYWVNVSFTNMLFHISL